MVKIHTLGGLIVANYFRVGKKNKFLRFFNFPFLAVLLFFLEFFMDLMFYFHEKVEFAKFTKIYLHAKIRPLKVYHGAL